MSWLSSSDDGPWERGNGSHLQLLYTGHRAGDIVKMRRSDMGDGLIRVIQQKTGAELSIPLHPARSWLRSRLRPPKAPDRGRQRPSHPTRDPYADHAKSGTAGRPTEPLRATWSAQGDYAPPGRKWIIGNGNCSDFRTPHPQGDRAVHRGGRSSQVFESCNSQAQGRQNANVSV